MPALRIARRDRQTARRSLNDLRVTRKDSVQEFITFWSNRRADIMGPLEQQAYIQLAWTLGHQNLAWNDAGTELADLSNWQNSPWWEKDAIENRLLPAVEGRLTKYMARLPIWRMKPATGDEEDEQVAYVGTQVLRHYWRNVLDMYDVLYEAHFWAEVTFMSFMVAAWDAEAGPRAEFDASDFQIGENGETPPELENGKVRSVALGEVVVSVRNIFESFVDPASRNVRDANWLMFHTYNNREKLRDRYGTSAVGKLSVGEDTIRTPFHSRIMELGSSGLPRKGFDYDDDVVLVDELWVKPSKARPNGLHAVSAQGEILQLQKNPYQHRQIPVAPIHGVKVPNSVWGTCKVRQLMETQGSINENLSDMREFRRLHVHPKILDPNTGGSDDDQWTTAPGEVISHTPGQPPSFLNPPSMPNHLFAMRDNDLRSMEDQSDIHEVSAAKMPSGAKSGRVVLALQSQDEARFGPGLKHRNTSVMAIGRFVLSMLHQFVDEPRLIQTVGDDFDIEAATFKRVSGFIGGDLAGPNIDRLGVDYWRVEPEIDSELPLSTEGTRTVLESLAQIGFLNPDQDKEKVLRLFGMGQSDEIFRQSRAHRAMAMDENRQMADGEMVDPEKWNRHDLHIELHMRFMNTGTEYRRLPPLQKRIFNAHLTRHYHMAAIEALRPQMLLQTAQELAPEVFHRELQELRALAEEVEGNAEQPERAALTDAPVTVP